MPVSGLGKTDKVQEVYRDHAVKSVVLIIFLQLLRVGLCPVVEASFREVFLALELDFNIVPFTFFVSGPNVNDREFITGVGFLIKGVFYGYLFYFRES